MAISVENIIFFSPPRI